MQSITCLTPYKQIEIVLNKRNLTIVFEAFREP